MYVKSPVGALAVAVYEVRRLGMHFLLLTTIQFRYPHPVTFTKRASLVLSTLILTANVTAQSIATQSAAPQEKSQPASDAAKSAYDFSHEPIIYEFVRANMRYERDGTGVRDMTIHIRVQTAAGLPRVGQLVLDYNAANEKIEIRSVKVIKPDGSTITAGQDAVQDLSAPVTQQAPMYTDARQKHVTVPGLAVGDAVEYNVVTTSSPLMAGQFWQTWNFIADGICLDEQVELDVPRERALKIKSPPGVEPIVHDEGDRRIYRWATSTLELPKQANAEDGSNFDVKAILEGTRPIPPRQLLFSTLQSWDEVGHWYSGLEHDRRTVSPEIRAKADEIVRGRNSPQDKAEAIYVWVSRNIRYVSLSFGLGRYQPHAAEEVLRNRYGDCKDKATVIEALFDAEGLHAQPVLINSTIEVEPAVPSPLQFNHAITVLALDGHEIWLDSTLQVAPFGYLLPQLRGKQALVVSVDSPSVLGTSPATLPAPTLYKATLEGKMDLNRQLDTKIELDTRGDLEVLLRLGLMQLPPAQINALLERAASQATKAANDASKDGGGDLKLTDFKADDPTDATKPFHLEVRLHGKAPESTKEEATSPEKIAAEIGTAFTGSDGLLAMLRGTETKRSASGKTEQQLVRLDGPKEYALEVNLALPGIRKAGDEKPWHVHIDKEFAEYESSLAWDDQTLRGSLRLKFRVSEVPASRAKEYAAFIQQVGESFRSSSSPAPRGTATPSSSTRRADAAVADVPTGDAATAFQAGDAALRHGDLANAERYLDSATKSDPAYALAWRYLALARMVLGKYPEAETAIRKYVELAPDESYGYESLAEILNDQKKYDEAVALMLKRLATNPDDGAAHYRLGSSYFFMHKPDQAVVELEKAVRLLPKFRIAPFMLGQAYLQVHDYDNAAASFEKSITLDGSPLNLNNAAYELAVANTHLDVAERWASRAVQSVELELNQSKLPFQNQTMIYANQIAAYWDTLGWVKFQQKDPVSAEKYTLAAVQLSTESSGFLHLGKIYELQKRTNDAIDAFAEALALKPATRVVNNDDKEAQARLIALVGSDAELDRRVKQVRSTMTARRVVSIPNAPGSFGFSQFMVIVGPGSKVIEIGPFNPDDPLGDMRDVIRTTLMPQTFPDDVIQKLPRMGILSCSATDQPCTFALMPAVAASRVMAPAPMNIP